MNSVTLSGNITKDIELKKTNNGKTYCKFTLGVRKDKDSSNFPTCVAWNKTAELIAQYCGKGSKILVSGTLETGSYEGKNGKVYTTEVLVNNIEFLSSNQSTPKRDDRHSPSAPNLLDANDEVPQSVNEFFAGTGLKVEQEIDLDSSNLPFY